MNYSFVIKWFGVLLLSFSVVLLIGVHLLNGPSDKGHYGDACSTDQNVAPRC